MTILEQLKAEYDIANEEQHQTGVLYYEKNKNLKSLLEEVERTKGPMLDDPCNFQNNVAYCKAKRFYKYAAEEAGIEKIEKEYFSAADRAIHAERKIIQCKEMIAAAKLVFELGIDPVALLSEIDFKNVE